MQNSVISTRITSLHGSLPSSADFTCETATLGQEKQVSIGPRPHLWCFVLKAATLAPELQISMGPSPDLWLLLANHDFWIWIPNLYGSQTWPWFCACKTAWLAAEILVSMGPIPQLLFCVRKTTTLAPKLQVSMDPSPHLWLLRAKRDFWIWIPNLYGSQTWPMVLCMQNSVISNRNTSLHGSHTSAVVLCM